MSTGYDIALHTLAARIAATIHATVRHWWRDPEDERLLQIAAERAFVGARPIAVHFTVRLTRTEPVAVAGRPRMRVGVSVAPPPAPEQPAARRVRRPVRATGATPRKVRGTTRARARATVSAPQARKSARPSEGRAQRPGTPRVTAGKKPRRSSRG